jgi:hypothetical protein
MMEHRDWEIVITERETYTIYYAQTKSARNIIDEQILQSNLTKDEALALLSLIGSPEVIGVNSDCYRVEIDRRT